MSISWEYSLKQNGPVSAGPFFTDLTMKKTIKIKALTSAAGANFSIAAGEICDLPEEIALDMVRAGFAELFAPETRESKAANQRETATANKITPPRAAKK